MGVLALEEVVVVELKVGLGGSGVEETGLSEMVELGDADEVDEGPGLTTVIVFALTPSKHWQADQYAVTSGHDEA